MFIILVPTLGSGSAEIQTITVAVGGTKMSLIDREILMETLGMSVECEECQYHDQYLCNKSPDWVVCCEAIADAPAVEAVQVTRCRDCTFFREFDDDYRRRWRTNWEGACSYWNHHSTYKNWFCAIAKKRGEEECQHQF